MKKLVSISLLLLTIITISACNNKSEYRVGATSVPHAEILEHIKPILEEKGYRFEIIEFSDYVLPNSSLASGEIIANFFQHIPYLEAQIKEHNYDFVNVGGVHVEPIGLYTKKYNSIQELPNELTLIISNSVTDRPRLLEVLEVAGILNIKEDITYDEIINSTLTNLPNLFTSTKKITFKEIAAELLYTNYNNEEGDAVLINGNYALDNGLNPLTDSIALEGSESLYVNILVTTKDNEENEFVKAIIETLQSEEVQQWIEDQYDGAVVPAAN